MQNEIYSYSSQENRKVAFFENLDSQLLLNKGTMRVSLLSVCNPLIRSLI